MKESVKIRKRQTLRRDQLKVVQRDPVSTFAIRYQDRQYMQLPLVVRTQGTLMSKLLQHQELNE